MAIGKLSTNYPRMSSAHPHVYMNFRQALLANRKFLSKFSKAAENDLGKEIIESNFKVGFIANSSYSPYQTYYLKRFCNALTCPSLFFYNQRQ